MPGFKKDQTIWIEGVLRHRNQTHKIIPQVILHPFSRFYLGVTSIFGKQADNLLRDDDNFQERKVNKEEKAGSEDHNSRERDLYGPLVEAEKFYLRPREAAESFRPGPRLLALRSTFRFLGCGKPRGNSFPVTVQFRFHFPAPSCPSAQHRGILERLIFLHVFYNNSLCG